MYSKKNCRFFERYMNLSSSFQEDRHRSKSNGIFKSPGKSDTAKVNSTEKLQGETQ